MSDQRHRSRFEVVNGLHGLRAEIDDGLTRARAAIELYLHDGIDAGTDPAQLHVAADELRLVRGGLTLIDCFGAGVLAQEMLALIDALLAGRAARVREAFLALSGATLQLSDYVDLLSQGAPDRVLVLQPVINELRLAGARPLLTEAELFARQLQAVPQATDLLERPAVVHRGMTQALAKRELATFQTAFLLWFRGDQTGAALKRIGRISDLIAVNVEAPGLHEFWSGCAILAECMHLQSPDSLDLKHQFGVAGSQLRLLAEAGEHAALTALGDSAQQMLFHIAGAPHTSARAQVLIGELQLDVLLPPREEITELRRRLRGSATPMLNRVYEEIRRDFARIKDAIDPSTGGSVRADPNPDAARERLRHLAETVGALGLPAARKALLNQSVALAEDSPGARQWTEIVTVILRIEQSLQEALFRGVGRSDLDTLRALMEIEVPQAQDVHASVVAPATTLAPESQADFAFEPLHLDLATSSQPMIAAPPYAGMEVMSEWPAIELPPAIELSLDSMFELPHDRADSMDDAVRLRLDDPVPEQLPTTELPAEAVAQSTPGANLLLDEPFDPAAETIASPLGGIEPAPLALEWLIDAPEPPSEPGI